MSSLPLPIAAFFAGLVSFLSPCVLPLVPGYVSLISGVGVEELQAQESSQRRRVVLLSSLMFILGFSVVFISLGAVATTLGRVVREYFPWLIRIAGVVIILFLILEPEGLADRWRVIRTYFKRWPYTY